MDKSPKIRVWSESEAEETDGGLDRKLHRPTVTIFPTLEGRVELLSCCEWLHSHTDLTGSLSRQEGQVSEEEKEAGRQ